MKNGLKILAYCPNLSVSIKAGLVVSNYKEEVEHDSFAFSSGTGCEKQKECYVMSARYNIIINK